MIEDLSISGVERLLSEIGYDLADLVDVPAPWAPPGSGRTKALELNTDHGFRQRLWSSWSRPVAELRSADFGVGVVPCGAGAMRECQ